MNFLMALVSSPLPLRPSPLHPRWDPHEAYQNSYSLRFELTNLTLAGNFKYLTCGPIKTVLNKWAYIWTALVQTLFFKACNRLTTEPNLKSPEAFREYWGSIWPKQLPWPLRSAAPTATSVSAQSLSYLSGTITCLWLWWPTGTVAITRRSWLC